MLGKTPQTDQLDIFRPQLKQLLLPSHELVQLVIEVDWHWIEEGLKEHYAEVGRPSVPIRCIVGMLLLKHMFNESDESVLDRWVENPYWQYFTGEQFFQHEKPFDRSDFPKFRHRIGEQGMEKILSLSINRMAEATTSRNRERKRSSCGYYPTGEEYYPQWNWFPTDTKLYKKIIERCRKIAKVEGIDLRQSYRRKLKQLMLAQRNSSHPKRKKQARAAQRKIKTIAGRLVRVLDCKLPADIQRWYSELLTLFKRVLTQQRFDKNKIYSLHAPEVCRVASTALLKAKSVIKKMNNVIIHTSN